ncbi:hypothetical protein [Microcoleus sp. bin38.metabat.b11b12b14.051]|uniref:hypothetical protein n=1 Tax=Microcoleus sp. bin38.metabat.b11b12b14.051 TaxID=2742709 RepID=UPI0025E35BA8|nr:hypothetical protein [Microcoleus sp. bin38.metabat.b11b12b14.051]
MSKTFTHLNLLQRWGLGFTRRIHFRSMSLELYQILCQISSFVDRLCCFNTVPAGRSRFKCYALYQGEKDGTVHRWAFEYFQATIGREGA